MKKLIITTISLIFLFTNISINAQSKDSHLAEEILEKCIQFHDPEGTWKDYSGMINLNHVNAKGFNNGLEKIEIDVKDNFYQCTHINRNGVKIVKGIKNDELILSVNGNTNLSEEEINKYGLKRENIDLMKSWHYFHFGKVMHLKEEGLKLKEEVSSVVFNNIPCYEIILSGINSKTSHSIWKGDYTLKIDKENYALKGMEWQFNNRNISSELKGIVDINGIKVSMVALYSEAGVDNIAVDLFSKVKE